MFRAIDRWGAVADRALTRQSINLIVKATLRDGGPRSAGLFGASVEGGISPKRRGGGIALQEAMQQSQHRPVQQAASDHNEVDRAKGRAVRLGI